MPKQDSWCKCDFSPTIFTPGIVGHQGDSYNSAVTRLRAKIVLMMALLLSPCLAVSKFSSKIEKVDGQIVAYSTGLTCLNGNAYWSMLIHVRNHTPNDSPQFVEVRFSLPCNSSPEWLTGKSSPQKFQLTRDHDADSILKEFFDCVVGSPSDHLSEPCPQVTIWKLVPGAEHEKLPFGLRLPSYRSVALPLVPVV
jgi:hypothetical protein